MLVMTNKLMTLVYTYFNLRIKRPPDIAYTLTYLVHLVVSNSSSLAWDIFLQGRDLSLNHLSPFTAFAGTNNQEVPTDFNKSVRLILWDSVHSLHSYVL